MEKRAAAAIEADAQQAVHGPQCDWLPSSPGFASLASACE
jgi:hypothetical protein